MKRRTLLYGTPALLAASTLTWAQAGYPVKPIRYIVLTQSHANQFGGLEIYKTPENQVIAHRNYPEDRRYTEALSEHYRRGSRRIFRPRASCPTTPSRTSPRWA